MKNCNVYFDGSNYYAVPIVHRNNNERAKSIKNSTFKKAFNEVYDYYMSRGCSRSDLYKKICHDMKKNYGGNESLLKDKIRVALIDKAKAEAVSKERFRRKGMLHLDFWTHFITCTYNPVLMTEEVFEKRLRKLFSNCHTRQGWVIMGRFERAPETGRLHFHGLGRIPFGSSFSEIEKCCEYNPLTCRNEERYENVYFDTYIGRSDFKPVDNFDYCDAGVMANVMDYIVKYSNKTGGKIFYSRGIPTGIEIELSEYVDFVNGAEVVKKVYKDGITVEIITKHVLWKDIFIEKGDKYFDVRQFVAKEKFAALRFG